MNCYWVISDNRLPYIGDDARWLVETNNLTNLLKVGDFQGFSTRWSNLFMQDTNSVPRTPLFTLLSIPGFLLFGASTDVAIVSNLIVYAVASWVVYLFVLEVLKQERQKELLGLITVILFNLFPGYFGMARLYMSEILQTTFVVLLSLLTLKWGKQKLKWRYLLLGILSALGLLLRFILPIYLLVPAIIFIYQQAKLKYKFKQIVLRVGLFLFGLVPLMATWYGHNLMAYWAFSRYTAYGALAEVTSLGPVWSPLTWLKYWKVIGLWHFSWPWLMVMAGTIVAGLIKQIVTKAKRLNIWKLTSVQQAMLYLLAIPLPALIVSTLSVNKTARYFLPVEVFWIILFVYIFWLLLQFIIVKADKAQIKLIFIVTMMFGFVLAYPYCQSVIVYLPTLPGTGYLSSTLKPLATDNNVELYEFVRTTLVNNSLTANSLYLIPEQVRLNDAELQWYFTTKGTEINSLGEFSAQHTYEEGKVKIETADVLLIDFNPEIADAYQGKYEKLLNYIATVGGYNVVSSHEFDNGARLIIMKKQNFYALL